MKKLKKELLEELKISTDNERIDTLKKVLNSIKGYQSTKILSRKQMFLESIHYLSVPNKKKTITFKFSIEN
jgi:hypothetical protein